MLCLSLWPPSLTFDLAAELEAPEGCLPSRLRERGPSVLQDLKEKKDKVEEKAGRKERKKEVVEV